MGEIKSIASFKLENYIGGLVIGNLYKRQKPDKRRKPDKRQENIAKTLKTVYNVFYKQHRIRCGSVRGTRAGG